MHMMNTCAENGLVSSFEVYTPGNHVKNSRKTLDASFHDDSN